MKKKSKNTVIREARLRSVVVLTVMLLLGVLAFFINMRWVFPDSWIPILTACLAAVSTALLGYSAVQLFFVWRKSKKEIDSLREAYYDLFRVNDITDVYVQIPFYKGVLKNQRQKTDDDAHERDYALIEEVKLINPLSKMIHRFDPSIDIHIIQENEELIEHPDWRILITVGGPLAIKGNRFFNTDFFSETPMYLLNEGIEGKEEKINLVEFCQNSEDIREKEVMKGRLYFATPPEEGLRLEACKDKNGQGKDQDYYCIARRVFEEDNRKRTAIMLFGHSLQGTETAVVEFSSEKKQKSLIKQLTTDNDMFGEEFMLDDKFEPKDFKSVKKESFTSVIRQPNDSEKA